MPQIIEAVSLTCPACGAPLGQTRDGDDQIVCEYCDTVIYIRDNSERSRPTPPRSTPEPPQESAPERDPYKPLPLADGEYFPRPNVIFASHAEQVFNEGTLELRRDGLHYLHGSDDDRFEYNKITKLEEGPDLSFKFEYPGSWFGEMFQRCGEYSVWITLIVNAKNGNFPER